jgi:hypothetical protein
MKTTVFVAFALIYATASAQAQNYSADDLTNRSLASLTQSPSGKPVPVTEVRRPAQA